MNIFEETEAKASQEVFIIEHVRFNPSGEDIEIWVRNTGKIDIIIDKISIVKVNTQQLVVSKEGIDQDLFQKNYTRIALSSSDNTYLPVSGGATTWQQVFNSEGSGEYRITISTIRDKAVESIVGLFNS